MRLQFATSLALLATASSVVADDVVSMLWPSSADGYDAKLIGTTGGALTTLVINCPATASSTGPITSASAATTSAAVAKRATTASSSDDDDDDDCDIPAEGRTVVAGSSTWSYTYSGTDLAEYAACTYSGTTWLSCALTVSMDGQVSSDNGASSTEIPKVPITVTATVSGTGSSASATGTASGSTASATGKSSSSTQSASGSSSSSASASASTSDSGAMAFATGASQLVAGGAAMMIALAMA
ncbi:hypothetical protein BO94DRAFT_550424 [Aspergillus sclerotioniger CBS 115572]|uniref:GPI anchored protein n=1 Tax=Aspergillus sclerotioniger CBS 115572 TaxID=1450535 RepID=A0A317VGR8_9EURO|nr:hypothetical protein BO94DRAFT_550424 [Aspergillus sclerotioniger CBS 115572]PWY71040.1 hypothetical protein BO94DRAFT_550424 [Aspergillus sclerotioniger CBS 115572]